MTASHPEFWLTIFQIVWIDVLLSGDNAVVIALACRKLPSNLRLWGIGLGTVAAIILRVVFTGAVASLMNIPYIKLIGGVLLIWIAIKLLNPEENATDHLEPAKGLWHAIKIIVIADWVMSLDNVIAIAAAARGSYALLMFGLAVSIPLIMIGAAAITALTARYPIIIWAGAALLGWIAGEIIGKDRLFTASLDHPTAKIVWLVGASLGALFVVGMGLARRRGLRRGAPDQM